MGSGRDSIFLYVRILLMLLVPIATVSAQPRQERRQTAEGALERADRRLEFVNRGAWLESQNFGLNGRKNATSDAARDAEEPRAVQQGFSPWSRW